MEVRVNGYIIELGNSMPAVTKKSIDIDNLQDRFVAYTNSFVIPDTNVNRLAFESPKGIGTNNRSFEKQYDVVIEDNTQIFRGKGFLSQNTYNTYTLQVVDPSKDVFNVFDKELKELTAGYEDLDTTLTTTNIDDLDSYDIDEVFYWGKACYHEDALQINTDQTTGDSRCKYSRPAFNLQSFLKLICSEVNYAFTPPDLQLAMSSNHNDFFFTSYQKTLSGANVVSGTLTISGLDTNDFEQGVTAASTSIDIGTLKHKFRVRGSITSTAAITLIVKATDSVDSSKVVQAEYNLTLGNNTLDFTTSDFQSDNGMDVELILSGTGTVTFNDTLFYSIVSEKDADLSTNPFLNFKIKVYDNLPDLTFKDLYRTQCVCANLQPDVDTFDKVFAFRSMANINKMLTEDWSTKFVIESETVMNYSNSLFQTNFLRYTNDRTVRTDLGQSSFLVDNESLQDTGTYLSLPFSASIDTTINSNTIVQVPCYNDTTRITEPEPSIRLFYINSDKLQFSAISWDSLKENYYQELFDSLYRSRAIDCQINLNKLDFLKWNPRRLVYIDYFKSTFFVLEIANYIPGRLTSVKLLKYG